MHVPAIQKKQKNNIKREKITKAETEWSNPPPKRRNVSDKPLHCSAKAQIMVMQKHIAAWGNAMRKAGELRKTTLKQRSGIVRPQNKETPMDNTTLEHFMRMDRGWKSLTQKPQNGISWRQNRETQRHNTVSENSTNLAWASNNQTVKP